MGNVHTPRGECQVACIPPELSREKSWLVWRFEEVRNPDGSQSLDEAGNPRRTKVPYNARTGHHAKSNDPRTWSSVDDALATLGAGGYDGVGFAIPHETNIVGIDVDVPVDNQLAQAFIARFRDTYCERSPSGKLRIWCRGKPQRCGKGTLNKRVELYASGSPRYLTHTGDHVEGTGRSVVDAQEVLDWVHDEFMDPALKERHERVAAPVVHFEDHELVKRISASKHGVRFIRLMQTAEGVEDDSGVDQAICNMLAFWTRDPAQIERIWSTAVIAQRRKFQREDYRRWTVDNALEFVTETYKPRSERADVDQVSQPQQLAESPFIIKTIKELVDTDFGEPAPFVDGMVYPGLTLVVARPKVGKSWLGLNMLLAVASGTTIFGDVQCHKANTLGLILEDGPRRTQYRALKQFGQAARMDTCEIANVWPHGLAGLRKALDDRPDTRFVVIDTWARFRSFLPASSASSVYQQDYEQMAEVQELAVERDMAIVVIHHTRKSNKHDDNGGDPLESINGTNGITGAADSILVIDGSVENGHRLYIRGRDITEREYDIQLVDGLWRIKGERVKVSKSSQIADAVRMRDEGMSLAEIAKELGRSKSTIHDWLELSDA